MIIVFCCPASPRWTRECRENFLAEGAEEVEINNSSRGRIVSALSALHGCEESSV